MSTGSAIHASTTLEASPNEAVIAAIRGHHAQLAEQLRVLTDAAVAAAETGTCARERDELYDWYRTELLPHAAAEEQALYSRGADLDSTRLLIDGMVAEHRSLQKLTSELGAAIRPMEVATAAAAAAALFAVHLSKENDLLLPALDAAGLDFHAILEGMHEILGQPQDAAATQGAAAGCGCGHDHHDGGSAEPASVPFVAGPAAEGTPLDVRTLPHVQRHEIIFGRLDALAPGQALVILNDHDPKPLRYQASAMWPDRFEWSYLEAGPVEWRVAITRVG
jgi:uncharacterized protein (DUF2249 family)